MPIIELNQLKFNWNHAVTTDDPSEIINIDHWHMNAGEHIFLYGPSGSGKSTFLNLLCGVLECQQGQIKLFDTDFTKLSARQRDRFRANNIGVVFQQFNLIPYLTVLDNLSLAAHFASDNDASVIDRGQALCEALGLSHSLLHQKANQLSVGQQQRVAIVRALINHPKLLIADEPTSALDSDSRDQFIKLLLETTNSLTAGDNVSVIFVSHDKSLAHHFDQQLHINDLNRKQDTPSQKEPSYAI